MAVTNLRITTGMGTLRMMNRCYAKLLPVQLAIANMLYLTNFSHDTRKPTR
jgi:hypothetical protein